MTVKEKICVLNKTCPFVHVSKLVGRIDLLAYADPYQHCATVTLVPLVLAGPPKVEGVTIRNNTVKDGKICQEVKWNALVLRYSKILKYRIRYGVSARLSNSNPHRDSSEAKTTLELNFNTSNITYYVQVAVKSTQKRGDFSDPIAIAYTSEYIRMETVGTCLIN